MRKKIDHVNQSGSAGPEALELLHTLMHRLRARQLRELEAAELGINPMEGKVLGFFARHPGATATELAAHSGRDKGQLARLVAGLRERGLLDARPDEQDRRVTRLQLSAAAQALHRAVQQRREALAVQALAPLSPDEQAQLTGLLQRLLDGLGPSD